MVASNVLTMFYINSIVSYVIDFKICDKSRVKLENASIKAVNLEMKEVDLLSQSTPKPMNVVTREHESELRFSRFHLTEVTYKSGQ